MIKRIEREGGTRYQVYGKADGKTVYVGTYDSKREAKDAEEDHRTLQRRVKRGEVSASVDHKRTVNEAADAWLDAIEGSRSHRPYSEFMKYQIRPILGDTPIASIIDTTIDNWRETTLESYAPTTVNSALGCLSSMLEWCVKPKRWLDENPCRGVGQATVPDRRHNWIKTRGELERLLLACSDELRDMVAISVGTMLRIGELLALHWDDVNLETRLITVQRGSPTGPPKGKKIRDVPILDAVLPILQRRALKRGGSPLVFPGKGGAYRAQTPVTCAFKSALKRAQMDTSLRWHDLRHTGAAWWVRASGDIFRLSRLMGHANVQITSKVYAHHAPDIWTQDHARIVFRCPDEPAKIVEFKRTADGKLAGRSAVIVDARAAG